jgi:hypothetical protein
MSKTKRATSQRRAPPAGPSRGGRREVVIKLDRRFLYGVLAVAALGVALLAGIFVGQLSAPAPAVPAASIPQAGAQVPGDSGLVVTTVEAPAIPGLDPNLNGYQVATYSDTYSNGPRVAVSDVDALSTFDFGDIPADKKAEHTFKLKNVGNQDLVIDQVHASCGCTIPSVAGQQMDKEGKLERPLALKPGEEQDLSITYDPQALGDEGEISKFIQIFSNDATGRSGETRFRLTGNVVKQ